MSTRRLLGLSFVVALCGAGGGAAAEGLSEPLRPKPWGVGATYYYLGVVVAMYMRPPPAEDRWAVVSPPAALTLVASVAVTLLLGTWPAPLLRAARQAVRSLMP